MSLRGRERTGDRTRRDIAVRALRDRILTAEIPARTRLDLDALAAEFGISRTPVREALLQLSYESLVEFAPRSGITVLGMSARDSTDNFEILAALSGKAAQWAAERRTEEQLGELTALHEQVLKAAETGGDELVTDNWLFHRVLNEMSGSRRLLALIRQAVRVVPTNYLKLIPHQTAHIRGEHDALVRAIADRDGVTARVIAEQHIIEAGALLSEWLREQRRDLDD